MKKILVVDDKLEVVELGATGYIIKPFSPSALLKRIEEILAGVG